MRNKALKVVQRFMKAGMVLLPAGCSRVGQRMQGVFYHLRTGNTHWNARGCRRRTAVHAGGEEWGQGCWNYSAPNYSAIML
jgi:hypothetical protein